MLYVRLLPHLRSDVINHRHKIGPPGMVLAEYEACKAVHLWNFWSNAHFSAMIVDCVVICLGIATVWKPFTASCTVCRCCWYEQRALALFIYAGLAPLMYEQWHLMHAFYCICEDIAVVQVVLGEIVVAVSWCCAFCFFNSAFKTYHTVFPTRLLAWLKSQLYLKT